VIFLHKHKRDDGYVAAERLRIVIAALREVVLVFRPVCSLVKMDQGFI
jgi:hypothetical protein